MSINTAHAQGGVLIFACERILIYYDGIEMTFEGPGNLPQLKGKKKGRCYLTTHRVIFNSCDGKDSLQSFSFPFLLMKEVGMEQPVFGSNYIKGKIRAEPQDNWGEAKWKMYFTHGGAIEFGQAMLKAASLASRNRPANPPPYTPPTANFGVYAAPPPAYQPPMTSHYAWVPYNTFPTAPPASSIYMTEAPPPYPGIGGEQPYPPAYPPSAPSHMNGHDAKAKEAAASAYADPMNQHNFYAPSAQASAPPAYSNYNAYGSAPPPSYSDAEKKEN